MIFVLLVASVFAVELYELPLQASWQAWQRLYDDSETLQMYGATDERFEIFSYNHNFVNFHNKKNTSWTLALNEFAILTSDEFAQRNGFLGREAKPANPSRTYQMKGIETPDSVDWRDMNLVTDVKNQGSCGSCWAFSTVVGLEGQLAKKTAKLTSLSEQDLVDCVKRTDNCCNGCQGGLMDAAYDYIVAKQDGKDDTEMAYPYTGRDGRCSYTEAGAMDGAVVTGHVDISDEAGLVEACATVGPISVAVNANIMWQLYSGGVLDPAGCLKNKLDHGVAVVGYGTDRGKDYWIIKNSWGKTWGERGYMRLVRGSNACGIANGPPSYPEMN